MKKSFCLFAAVVMLFGCACAQEVQALFINVGKADAALLFLGDARYLVDTGTKGSHDQLVRVLDAYGVKHLDGVIVTHTDKDHAGGLKKLLKSGVTTDMLYAGVLHSEKDLNDHPVVEAGEKYGVPITWLRAGDSITSPDGSVFHVLGPLTQDDENENNNSLVIRLSTPEGDMLLTGDMELDEEAELMQAGVITRATVLKVPHHGEDDATSLAFALVVQPQWAVISTSTAEEPDTPDSKIITRLWKAGSSIAVTQDAQVGVLILLKDGHAQAQEINWK